MFTEKQMQIKAVGWINEMKRARQGVKLKSYSIPAGLEEAKVLARKIFYPKNAQVLCMALDLAFKEEAAEPGEVPSAPPEEGAEPPSALAEQKFCDGCPSWKMMGSRIKGKLIPGGSGKCTRQGGLCENHVPKDQEAVRQAKVAEEVKS